VKKDLKLKKKLKKLELSRETLRNLSERDLQTAVGGVTASQCSARCTAISCLC
jgi:natural product precursor